MLQPMQMTSGLDLISLTNSYCTVLEDTGYSESKFHEALMKMNGLDPHLAPEASEAAY